MPAVNQEFANFKLKQVPVTRSHSRKIDMPVMSLLVTQFQCPMFKKLTQFKIVEIDFQDSYTKKTYRENSH